MVLYQRAAALYPIPAVTIDHVVQLRDFRAVNVTTNDAIHAKAGGLIRNDLLEVADELHGILHLVLEKPG